MRLVGHRAALRLLVAAFLLRALFLGLALPYGDPLDEWFHFAYAGFVSSERRVPGPAEPSIAKEFERPGALLPCSSPTCSTKWKGFAALSDAGRLARRQRAYAYSAEDRQTYLFPNYETQQPPLFYLVAAAPLALLPRAPFDVRLLVVRLLAGVLAAAAVPLSYRFFRALFPRGAALAATAALVAIPSYGSFVGRFTNDALAVALVAATLLFFVRASQGRLTVRAALLWTLLLAAGLWTKLYVLTLLPAAPIVAMLAPPGRRRAAILRSLLAVLGALALFAPWMLHQHALSGDWLGLTPTREAVRLGLGPLQMLAATPALLRPEFGETFAKTFLYPGTWSVMGASSGAAAALVAGLLAVVLPGVRHRPLARPRRRRWAAAGLAIVFFLGGQAAHAAAFAAIARARAEPSAAGAEGWYVLVLLPSVLAGAAAFGGSPAPRRVAAGVALFLAGEAWMTFGALPAVYSGVAEPGRVTASSVAAFLSHPSWALGTYARVGLAAAPAWLLAAIVAGWIVSLAAVVVRLVFSRRP